MTAPLRHKPDISARAVNALTLRRTAYLHKAARFTSGLLLLVLADVSASAAIQDLESVRAAAHRFVAAQPQKYSGNRKIRIGRLDPRLRLTKCQTPLQVSFAHGSRPWGNATVGVQCNNPKAWTIYIPLRVSVFKNVVVAARSIARGRPLRREDLTIRSEDLTGLSRTYLTSPNQLLGMIAKRPLNMGTVLSPDMVAAPRLIKRGQRVTIIAKSGGIEVRMTGEALADGARGEIIRVRNILTRRVIQAVVADIGVVEVQV